MSLLDKMEDINKWLSSFKEFWIKKDIDSIINLFSDDIEYWESPTEELRNKKEIKKQWQEIKSQNNIKLDFEVCSKDDSKFKVKWNLEFFDKEKQEYSGFYLIALKNNGKCNYFLQNSQND